MSAPVMVGAVLGAVFCGYLIGRARPYERVGDWAIDRIRFGDRWRTTKLRQATLLAIWALTCPRDAVQVWRDRPRPVTVTANHPNTEKETP